jgi:threonine/homoserine/homoserine lactone efflux protein
MLETSDLMLYCTALVAAYLLPGPDMVLITHTTLEQGRRAGLATAAGLASARSLHVLASGLGLAALLQTHPLALDALRWLGAAYLQWLAWRILPRPTPSREASGVTAAHPAPDAGRAYRRGLLTNLLNPKAFMFCGLLLPQFVQPGGHLEAQYLVLGALLVAWGCVFDLGYVLVAGQMAQRGSTPATGPRRICAGFFVLTALRLMQG